MSDGSIVQSVSDDGVYLQDTEGNFKVVTMEDAIGLLPNANDTEQEAKQQDDELLRDKDGNIDYNTLLSTNPDAYADELVKKLGQQKAVDYISTYINTIDDTISKLEKIIKSELDNNKRIKSLEEIDNLKAQREVLTNQVARISNIQTEQVQSGQQVGVASEQGEEVKEDNGLFSYFQGSIKELILKAREKGDQLAKKILSSANDKLISDLHNKGIDIDKSYNHTIDNNAINHVFNRHGTKKEKLQGQIPITESDIENIQDVIDNYDNVETSKNNHGQDVIIYSKSNPDGTTFYVEEVRNGRKELALVTMYKNKKSTITDENLNNLVSHTPVATSDLGANSKPKGTKKSENEQKPKPKEEAKQQPQAKADKKAPTIPIMTEEEYLKSKGLGTDKKSIDARLQKAKERDEKKIPYRIDSRTTILVTPKEKRELDKKRAKGLPLVLDKKKKGKLDIKAVADLAVEVENARREYREKVKNGEIRAPYEHPHDKEMRKEAKSTEKQLGVKVNIVTDNELLPDSESKAKKAISIGLGVQGWFNPKNGEVFIYLQNVPNVQEMKSLILHEVVAHKGLKEMLAKDVDGKKDYSVYNRFLESVYDMMSFEDKRKYIAYIKNKSDMTEEEFVTYSLNVTDRRDAADEYVAHFAEHGVDNPNIWQKICDIVRELLHKEFHLDLDFLKRGVTDADIAYMLYRSNSRLRAQTSAKRLREIETSIAKGFKDVLHNTVIDDTQENETNKYKISSDEDAVLTDAVNQKNLVYNQGRPIDYAYTANNFYVYDNPNYNNGTAYDKQGINTTFTCEIVGNEDLINIIEKGIQNGTIRNSRGIDKSIADFKRRKRHANRNNADASKERRGNAGFGNIHLGQQTNSRRDNENGSGFNESTTSGAADERADERISNNKAEAEESTEIKYLIKRDLKDDEVLSNLADKYWNDGISKQVNDANSISELNGILDNLSDGIIDKYSKKRAKISKSRARADIANVQNTNPREMAKAANMLGVVYQTDVDKYSDSDIDKLVAPTEDSLTNSRRQIGSKWNDILKRYTSAERYLVLKALYKFISRETEAYPIGYIKVPFEKTMSDFAKSTNPISFNFYQEYNNNIINYLGEDKDAVVEINSKTGISGTWVKMHKASDSNNVNETKIKVAAASYGTNWCTTCTDNPETGAMKVIEVDNHDFYVFFPKNSTQASLALVPIQKGQEKQLQNNQWYTGIFKRSNGSDNRIEPEYFDAVNGLAKHTKDVDIAYTLEQLGYNGMSKEEMHELQLQKNAKQVEWINNHDTITVNDFNDIQQLFGISLVRNGDSIGLHEFNIGIYEQVTDVVRDDFWNKLFYNISYIEGYAYFRGSQITSLGNLQSIGGNAEFYNSQITSLGNLQSINGDADFRGSQITDLGNLQSIKGNAYFLGSQITSLGNLNSIDGYADFSSSQITDLGNLNSINGSAYFNGSKVTDLGNLQSIKGDAHFNDSKITSLGNLQSIKGDAHFSGSQISSLGNLKSIGYDAYFGGSQITSLGNLQSIGGYADFSSSQITDLGNLNSINGGANFYGSKVTDLGNLQSIKGDAHFNDSKITSLGNLQSIKGDAHFSGSQISSLGNLKSIGYDAYFGGSQITSLGNLQSIGRDAYFGGSQITDLGNLQSIKGNAYFRDNQIVLANNLETINGKSVEDNSHIKRSEAEEEQTKFRFSNSPEDFDSLHKEAVKTKGIVAPNLKSNDVEIVNVSKHDFKGEKPIKQAEDWAKKYLAGEHISHKGESSEYTYTISNTAIEKYLSESSISKSENLGVHLAALKMLPEIIDKSKEVEVHADYKKGKDGVRKVENGYNDNVLIHRMYGAINIDGDIYRIKTTIQEHRDTERKNKPYSYEVTKIELLEKSDSPMMEPDSPNLQKQGLSIGTANLLKGVEKSYDKGKYLLDESEDHIRFRITPKKQYNTEYDDLSNDTEAKHAATEALLTALRQDNGLKVNVVSEAELEENVVGENAELSKGIKASIENLKETESFILDVLDGEVNKTKQYIDVPEIANRLAEKAIGHKITSHKIKATEIQHINKRHGEKGTSNDTNSIPLRKEDIALAPYIMAAPTRVEKGNSDIIGRESVKYIKELSNGVVYVVEREGNFAVDDMENITMYANKKSPANVAVAKIASHNTSETIVISTSDSAKIRKDAETAIENDEKEFQKGYHGTDVLLRKKGGNLVKGEELGFDLSFISEGVGDQVYGYGAYISTKKHISVGYAKQIAEDKGEPFIINWKYTPETGSDETPVINEADIMLNRTLESMDIKDYSKVDLKDKTIVAGVKQRLENEIREKQISLDEAKSNKDAFENALEKLSSDLNEEQKKRFESQIIVSTREVEVYTHQLEMATNALKYVEKNGLDNFSIQASKKLYELEIPDDTGENYIAWEQPLTKSQKDKIRSDYFNLIDERSEESEQSQRLEKENFEEYDLTGEDLYGNISLLLDGDKEASEFLSGLGFTGISVPIKFQNNGKRSDGLNYVIFNENDIKITDYTEFQHSNGTVYGWAEGNTIHLVKERLNPNTPIHEYTHVWARFIQKMNPKEWAKIVGWLKDTPVWNEVVNDKGYKNLTDDNAIASEVLSRISGRKNSRKVIAEMQKAIDEAKANGRVFELAEKMSVLDRIKKALNSFWNWVGKDLFNIHFNSVEEVADRVLYDMIEETNVTDIISTEEQTKFKISTEEQSIKETAKANGTYMKAPNGKPTKLSERQWLQVRTKAFKKWFGDWEKAARIEKLRKSEPIEITGKEVTPSDDLKEYKKNALEYGKSLRGEYTNRDTRTKVEVNAQSVKEVLHHDYKNKEQLQSVAAIPQIIEEGIYIDTSPNEDIDTNSKVKEYQYYVTGLKIGDIDYTVKSVIAVDNNGNRYYDHALTKIEKGNILKELDRITSPSSQENTALSDIKDKRLLSLLQTNVSKVVDENGEPMSEAVDEFDERIKYKQVIDEKSGVLTNDDKMTRRDKFNRLIIDSFAPVEKLKNIIKKLGGHIGVYSDPVGQAYLMLSKAKSNYDYFNLNHFAPMDLYVSQLTLCKTISKQFKDYKRKISR